MTNQEIANWAGISINYFSRNRRSWCEKNLSKCAMYELHRGYIDILEIKKPVRIKKQPKTQELSKYYRIKENERTEPLSISNGQNKIRNMDVFIKFNIKSPTLKLLLKVKVLKLV